MKIAGSTVLVTGANRGLGKVLVEEALRRGAKRVYAGARQRFAHADQFAQLAAFVALAESCSFTKAAVQLGIGTARLSQAIRALEERYGIRLLNRITRSVSPTDAGEHLLRHLKPILENVEEAEDVVNKFRDTPAGHLRLSVHPLVTKTAIPRRRP
jgi:DNA-binding transcriptional LysR family regulator